MGRQAAAAALVLALAGCGTTAQAAAPTVRDVAPKNINMSTGPLIHIGTWTTQEVVAGTTGLPVGGTAQAQNRTIARMVVPVDAGDIIKVNGWQRVTNNIRPVEFGAGVAWWIDVYDVDDGLTTADPDRVWLRISSWNGMNVDNNIVHHLPLTVSGVVWKVPADWPAGHRATVCFRADAHSTAWNRNGGGDRIDVDDYGNLTVDRYKPA